MWLNFVIGHGSAVLSAAPVGPSAGRFGSPWASASHPKESVLEVSAPTAPLRRTNRKNTAVGVAMAMAVIVGVGVAVLYHSVMSTSIASSHLSTD